MTSDDIRGQQMTSDLIKFGILKNWIFETLEYKNIKILRYWNIEILEY